MASTMADEASAQSGRAAMAPQTGGLLPESPWLPFIEDVYPRRFEQTYFLPPLHFSKVPRRSASLAGEEVMVYEQPQNSKAPQPRPRRIPTAASPLLPVAGSVFTRNTPGTELNYYQQSDLQDDSAQRRTLQALRALTDHGTSGPQAMMVVSQLHFRKYLDNVQSPVERAAVDLLPSLAPKRNGEIDILIIHRYCGLVIGEIKSTGGKDWFSNISEGELNKSIVKKVWRVIEQLTNQHQALTSLVSDLGVKITKTVILPNISAVQLLRAMSTDADAEKALTESLQAEDLPEAVGRCMCTDQFPSPDDIAFLYSAEQERRWCRLRMAVRHHLPWLTARLLADSPPLLSESCAWWKRAFLDVGPDPKMSAEVYNRLLARFCGPATTVEIPTPTKGNKVLRTLGHAVAETGLLMSSLALYPGQVELLSLPKRSVFMLGPPGCGKTVVLVLKALQWLREGHNVHLLSLWERGRLVSLLMQEQLRCLLQSAPEGHGSVYLHHFDLRSGRDTVADVVKVLCDSSSPEGHLHVIADEAGTLISDQFLELCSQLSVAVAPESLWLWAAGMERLRCRPQWMEEEALTVPLRCPPVVQREVARSTLIGSENVPSYTISSLPAPADGPPVKWLKHRGQRGHRGSSPDVCTVCGTQIADLLQELHVGQPGHEDLTWRDVIVLCYTTKAVSSTFGIVQGLECRNVPVRVLTTGDSDTNALEVAKASSDHVTVTDANQVAGLERRVVVGMGSDPRDRMWAMSRCTAQLVWIDKASS